jgi:predicted metal-binding membrane protein
VQALAAIRRRPTVLVEAAVAAAWVALAAGSVAAWGSGGSGGGALWSDGPLWICTTGVHGASTAGARLGAGASSRASISLLAAAPMWALMSGAMMVPAAMPAVRHVAVHSLYWRRRRAMAEFLLAFLAVWLLFSVFALGALTSWGPSRSSAALPIALALAALWQLTPFKWRALRACHRPSPLPPRGRRAAAGTVRFGLLNGSACLASCWAIMAAVALAGSPALPWMAAATALIYAEKLNLKPRTAARRVAVLLTAAALGVALTALLG